MNGFGEKNGDNYNQYHEMSEEINNNFSQNQNFQNNQNNKNIDLNDNYGKKQNKMKGVELQKIISQHEQEEMQDDDNYAYDDEQEEGKQQNNQKNNYNNSNHQNLQDNLSKFVDVQQISQHNQISQNQYNEQQKYNDLYYNQNKNFLLGDNQENEEYESQNQKSDSESEELDIDDFDANNVKKKKKFGKNRMMLLYLIIFFCLCGLSYLYYILIDSDFGLGIWSETKLPNIDWRYLIPENRIHRKRSCKTDAYAEAAVLLTEMYFSEQILSVQQLLDCDQATLGCHKGSNIYSIKYILNNKLALYEDYQTEDIKDGSYGMFQCKVNNIFNQDIFDFKVTEQYYSQKFYNKKTSKNINKNQQNDGKEGIMEDDDIIRLILNGDPDENQELEDLDFEENSEFDDLENEQNQDKELEQKSQIQNTIKFFKIPQDTTLKYLPSKQKGNCDKLRQMVQRGPVLVKMNDIKDILPHINLKRYNNRVIAHQDYDSTVMKEKPQHPVIIVGFTNDYWIILDTKGPGYGNKGMLKIKMGNYFNICNTGVQFYSKYTRINDQNISHLYEYVEQNIA
ncbi:hypothetical protein PPERSA_02787 [Pseudocohnilembus persalinus]|uniref:Peptidase C1A papain C-terminal domain-containing protein n=1 Tax=Pseudocohnilembus persalinus TaxID=266149 RepID=A0A0V0QN68_PSEPJ|nr:hypothetical protein PPERSA_02787 [Pseudocohnilembus persalinus]|eukprot:KRX03408.1 hypothetical protein PPERSA_02787 [Pseudocohnilembus persalinus]